MIPLLDTTLLTNAPGEPRVGNQIQIEIRSADRIDVVMAFIRYSGIQPAINIHRIVISGLHRQNWTGKRLETDIRTT